MGRVAQLQHIPLGKGLGTVLSACLRPYGGPAASGVAAVAPVVKKGADSELPQYMHKPPHVIQIRVAVEHGREVGPVVVEQYRGHDVLAGVKARRNAAAAVQQQAHMPRQP